MPVLLGLAAAAPDAYNGPVIADPEATSTPSAGAAPSGPVPPGPAPLRLRAGAALLIPVCVFAAFRPVLDNDFVDWDDQVFLTNNYRYRGLGTEQLRWAFTAFHEGHYQPLSWLTYGLDFLVWGMDPRGYHLSNLILHAANGLLVYLLALRLLGLTVAPEARGRAGGPMVLGATVAALLYVLHPMRVESVAWATERRDVLSGFFYLLTVLLYLRACARGPQRRPGVGALALCWLMAWAALLAKVMSVSLPFVLAVLDVYPLRRVSGDPLRWLSKRSRRVWAEKLPMLLPAIGFMILAPVAGERATSSLAEFGLADRLANAAYGYAFYLYKTAWPAVLLPLYEMPVRMNPAELRYLFGGAAVLIITVGLLLLRRKLPGVLAVWTCYLVILLPVIGLVQVGPQIVADRYSYLSCLGWFILGGWLVAELAGQRPERGRRRVLSDIFVTLCLFLVLACGVKTFRQTLVWRDSEALWSHVMEHDPQCSRALNGLGLVRYQQGRSDEALELFRRAIAVRPRQAEPYLNIGNLLKDRGDLTGAEEHYHKALEVHPGYADAIYNLGTIKAGQGRFEEAITHFRRALQAKPDSPEAHYNLGSALAAKDRLEEGAEHLRAALRLNPDYADALNNLGNIVKKQGQLDQALDYFQRALAIDPQSPEAHNNIGTLYRSRRQLGQAIHHYRQAVRFRPDYANAHYNLGNALLADGQTEEALLHFRRAVELNPDHPVMRRGLERARRAAGQQTGSPGDAEK